jgi:hypothetical protein
MNTEIGYTTVTLPSKGSLYDGAIPGGKVKVRKMTVNELSKLSQGGSPLDKIEGILKSTVKLPKGVDLSDLLITDRFFLLLSVRTASFGAHYTFRYKCQFCGSTERADVDISEDLRIKDGGVKQYDEDEASLEEPIDIPLPDAGCIVQARFLRGEDEQRVFKHAKRLKMQSTHAGDTSEAYRIGLQIQSRDGEEFDNPLQKQEFVRSLTAADTLRFERALDDAEPGVDLTVFPECGACSALNEMDMPFDAEFFRPSRL